MYCWPGDRCSEADERSESSLFGDEDEYERLVKKRRNEFLVLLEYYGLDKNLFTLYPENGGLENQEMVEIARELTGQINIMFDITSREASLRSFSSTIMELIEEANSLSKVERNLEIDDLFIRLGDLLGTPILQQVEVEEPEV